MKKRTFLSRLAAAGLALAMTALCAACSSSGADGSDAGTDRAGQPFTAPKDPKRVVSLAPSITQVLVEVGAADKLVAVDTYSPPTVPDLAADLPQFDMMAPDIEQLIALSPDLVLTSGMSAAGGSDPFHGLRQAGVAVADIPTSNSIADVEEDVRFIAGCVGKDEEGGRLVDEMRRRIGEVKKIGATVETQKAVLFEIAAAPEIYSFGSGVFLNEMIELAGARNIFADQEGWISVTEEAAIQANPDVILTNVSYLEDPVAEIRSRTGWEGVTALKNGDIHQIDNNLSSLPNHHIADALVQIARAVYPEAYASLEADGQ